MFLFSYLTAASFILFLTLGCAVLVKKWTEPVFLHFGLLLVSISIWCLGNYQADIALNGTTQIFWSNIALIAAYFGSVFHISFSYAFRGYNAWKKSLPYLIPALLTIPLLLIGIGSYHSPVIHYTSPGSVELGGIAMFYLLFLLVSTVHTAYILLKNISHLTIAKKHQTLLVLSGLMTMKMGGMFFSIILPLLGNTSFYSATPLASYAALIAIFFAITKHDFLNIKLIIQRGAIYLVLFGAIVCIYLILSFVLTGFLSENKTAGAALTLLFGLWYLPKLDLSLRKVTNPWFFKHSYELKEASRRLQKIVQKYVSVQEITQNSLLELNSILPFKESGVISLHQKKIFYQSSSETISPDCINILNKQEKQRVQYIPTTGESCPEHTSFTSYCPIIFNTTPVAAIGLGDKKNGEPLSQDDIALIETLANELSVAIQKAELFDEQKKYSHTLQAEVTKQTEEIKQLQESQEKAMLDISHSLKTPLTILNSEIEQLPEEQQPILQQTISQASRAVTSLLRLSKLRNEKILGTSHKRIQISALCELLSEYFKEIALKKHINLSYNITEDCYINGDYNQLEEALVNIIENAIAYMPKQENSSILINLEKEESTIKITITDNGLGITTEDQEKLFTRFYRSPKTNSIPGTGLGLSICKEIIELHDGRITVISRPGETTFTITLQSA